MFFEPTARWRLCFDISGIPIMRRGMEPTDRAIYVTAEQENR